MTQDELLKELKALQNENNKLKSKLMQTNLEDNTHGESPAQGPDSFRNERSSSIRIDAAETSWMSTFPTSGMSLGALNIPECSPSDGETEIDRKAYEHWRKILDASLDLMKSTDERTKIGIFKIKAGAKLLEVFESTKTSPGMPDEILEPYGNAIARLNEYFGSRTYMMSQRSKLLNMTQRKDESSVQFVRRVGAATKLCGYLESEEMESVMRTITKGALDSRVRKLAHRNWVRQGSIKDLVDAVQDSEIEKLNEEEFMKTQQRNSASSSGAAVIAAVERYSHVPSFRQGGFNGDRPGWNQAGKRVAYRGRRGGNTRTFSGRIPAAVQTRQCWRCSSVYHSASECPVVNKVCHKCQTKGHIARMCTSESGFRGIKRRLQSEQVQNSLSKESRRISMVNEHDEHAEEKEAKVFSDTDSND
nr:uncharacterized protein LOC115260959 [Aedes albopictus]